MNNCSVKPHPTWDVIDSTKLNDYIECSRKYFYRHILGWEPETPNNHLHFGAAWHLAMEHLLLKGMDGASLRDAQQKLRDYYRREFSEETDDIFSPKTPDRAMLALVEYSAHYLHDSEDFNVLYTEVPGAVPITDSMMLFYKIDSILQHRTHDYIFSMEHKTGTNFNNQWAMQWPLSVQVGGYTHALYCLYPQDAVRGVKVNGAFFKRTKAPLFEFQRIPCWKTPSHMRIWYEMILHHTRMLRDDMEILMVTDKEENDIMFSFPLRSISCNNYFGCPYHDFCSTWPNPLRRCDEPPLGFKVRYWDPRADLVEPITTLTPIEDMLDGMIQGLEARYKENGNGRISISD